MEMILKFTCDKCRTHWNSSESQILKSNGKIHTLTESEKDGLHCPNCRSDSVGSEEINL